jgi:hypothetical protein
MQTRDEIRQQVQTEIRNATQASVDAAREARQIARDAGQPPTSPAVAQTPVDGTFLLSVLQGEIESTRQQIAQLNTRVGVTPEGPRRDILVGQLDQATMRLDQLQTRLDAFLSGEAGAAPVVSTGGDFPPGLTGETIRDIAQDATRGFFILIGALAIGIPLVRAFARWLDRRTHVTPAADLAPRLERIEVAIDSVAIEVERMAEAQRYSSKVLSELRALPAPEPLAAWPLAPRDPVPVRTSTTE